MDEPGSVFVANPDVSEHWEEVRGELQAAFLMAKAAAVAGEGILFVVGSDDLLGRGGVGAAVVATALLSAARTSALEMKAVPVNTLAIGADTAPEEVSVWVRHLLEAGGPRGELVRLGGGHLGKALP